MLTLSLSVNVDDDIEGVELAAMSNINKVLIWGGFNSWVYPKLNLHHLLYGQQSQIIPIHSNFHLPFNSISPCDVALDRTVWRLRAGVVETANPLDVVMDGIVPLVGVASVGEVNTDCWSRSVLAEIPMMMMMMTMNDNRSFEPIEIDDKYPRVLSSEVPTLSVEYKS